MIDKEIQLPRKRLKKPQAAAAAGGPDGRRAAVRLKLQAANSVCSL